MSETKVDSQTNEQNTRLDNHQGKSPVKEAKDKMSSVAESPVISDLYDPKLYFNRELSWLKFNERVLEEAEDGENALLERLKFLAIFSTNLDEFIMIRYAGLKEQIDAKVKHLTADGRTPETQLTLISERLRPLLKRHRKHLSHVILPELAKQGVHIEKIADLLEAEYKLIDDIFHNMLFPVLTPLAVDPGHPFPRLPNLSFSLLIELRDPDKPQAELKTAVVQVPSILSRFFKLPSKSGEYRFVLSEDIIRDKAQELFPGYEVLRTHTFRLTRNADIEIAEDEAEDLLQVIEDEVRKRRWGDPVRLEVSSDMPEDWQDYLRDTFHLEWQDVYALDDYLNVGAFMEIALLTIPHLRDNSFASRLPSEYRGFSDVFSAIRHQDILIHHPFHAFDAVLELIHQAARDPNVLAIKQTLYRVGKNSPVVKELMHAAGNGKHVTAFVELKARFDEENNIVWAREMEREGVHVVYGLLGLKTHCKALLIVRREGDKIRRYVHLSTGNYNRSTSNLYTDLSLMSCDEELGIDVSELFNSLTGYAKHHNWRKLWVAPLSLRPKLLEAIEQEIDYAKAGKKARVIAKMNSLVDPEVIRKLYQASQAGVDIDLIVRGICCLHPGVKGVSERIKVRSIVGRFLEHSRIFYFYHDAAENIYLSSADWMQRNLNSRVETVFPIEDQRLKRKVMMILELCLKDNVKARELHEDGFYYRIKRASGQKRLNMQEKLIALSEQRRAQVDG
ncbi:MAG: polyphosphate kinase 1 [Deinococcales bacterium]